MKALLMFKDQDFQLQDEEPVGQQDLIQDLELDTLWDGMALGDDVIRKSSYSAVLSSLTTREQILYRQHVLGDCLQQAHVVREIYDLAGQAITEERRVYRGIFSERGEALVHRSITTLELFVGVLKQLRKLTEEHADQFASDGFITFFATLRRELDDDYFEEIGRHLRRLRFRDGAVLSARLGEGSQGIEYVLRSPREQNRSGFLVKRLSVKRPNYSLTVPDRDEAGFRALGELRDRGMSLVGNALGQSVDHILSFFAALRRELGFYLGCLNLHDQLVGKAEPECFPDPSAGAKPILSARALYDPCLSLRVEQRVTPNDLNADGKALLMITGANQGGKSTFLRSLGVAHLMMQCGMFVAAESFSSTLTTGVFTHYKREEDATMTSGKFDEELSRMKDISQAISRGGLLICNESFAATNEREGSEIAAEVVRAMNDAGIRVVFVTHLYDLAHRFYQEHADTSLFLRADRGEAGRRTFRVSEGEPLPTSYGADLYQRTFTRLTAT